MPESLGSAGCRYTGSGGLSGLCGLATTDESGNWRCARYGVSLEAHSKFNTPWRAKECTTTAWKDAESNLAKERSARGNIFK